MLQKITKPFKVWWGYIFFLYVTEEGWVRKGGKGEGGFGENFLYSCLSEYHSLFPVQTDLTLTIFISI